jgi:hypothetical protein
MAQPTKYQRRVKGKKNIVGKHQMIENPCVGKIPGSVLSRLVKSVQVHDRDQIDDRNCYGNFGLKEEMKHERVYFQWPNPPHDMLWRR